jgi:molybdenum cofactor biosynthesis protein B
VVEGLTMGLEQHRREGEGSLGVFVLTVSDTRGEATDRGGPVLVEGLTAAGHRLAGRDWVADEPETIRSRVVEACGEPEVDAVFVTGGTGLAARDQTPEALEPLFDPAIPGFGELFRALSFREIGSAAMLSRASAGVVAGRVVALLPGSPRALELAVRELLVPELGHLCAQARTRRP